MPAYEARFPVQTEVRIASRTELEQFRADWPYHHPLQDEQLAYADTRAKVATVGYYHGGDVLYTLEGVPGIWHDQCLRAVGSF